MLFEHQCKTKKMRTEKQIAHQKKASELAKIVNTGKHHSLEHRKKISKALGGGNPQNSRSIVGQKRILYQVLFNVLLKKMGVKYCRGCKEYHKYSMFYKNNNNRSGLETNCIKVLRAKNRTPKIVLYKREYYHKNSHKWQGPTVGESKRRHRENSKNLRAPYLRGILRNQNTIITNEAINLKKINIIFYRVGALISKVERGELPITEAKKEYERLLCLIPN